MVAAKVGIEESGAESFTNEQGRLLGEGFSFSGFERDGLYLNLGNKQYENISGISGIDHISDGRGAVYADFDNDGDTDVFMTTIQGQSHLLFRNNLGNSHHFLRVALIGNTSGRNAFGAVVRVRTELGTLTKLKTGGSGYVSQHDPRLLFGLGEEISAKWVEVSWPSGLKQRFDNVASGSSIVITEGKPAPRYVQEHRFSLPEPVSLEEQRVASLKIKKGKPFPDLGILNLSGKITSTHKTIPSGSKTLVNLWATWCIPCRKEMPELQEINEQGKVNIVGISLDAPETRNQVNQFLMRLKIDYPNYVRTDTLVEQIFSGDEVFIPVSFLLDDQGEVLEIFTGWSQKDRQKFDILTR